MLLHCDPTNYIARESHIYRTLKDPHNSPSDAPMFTKPKKIHHIHGLTPHRPLLAIQFSLQEDICCDVEESTDNGEHIRQHLMPEYIYTMEFLRGDFRTEHAGPGDTTHEIFYVPFSQPS